MKEARRRELPCPACGGRSYSWGRVSPTNLHFVDDGASRWQRILSCAKVPARRCDECGNLQLFTEPVPSRAGKRARSKAEADFS